MNEAQAILLAAGLTVFSAAVVAVGGWLVIVRLGRTDLRAEEASTLRSSLVTEVAERRQEGDSLRAALHACQQQRIRDGEVGSALRRENEELKTRLAEARAEAAMERRVASDLRHNVEDLRGQLRHWMGEDRRQERGP